VEVEERRMRVSPMCAVTSVAEVLGSQKGVAVLDRIRNNSKVSKKKKKKKKKKTQGVTHTE